MRVSTTFGKAIPKPASTAGGPQKAFRILVLTDLGAPAVSPAPVSVDRDNIDDVLKAIGSRIQIRNDERLPDIDIPLSDMDDFHPDSLYRNLDVFASLRTRRQRLQSDKTFAEESQAILASGDGVAKTAATDSGTNDSESPANAESKAVAADLLGAALDRTEAAQKPILDQIVEGGLDVDALAQQLVRPYVLQKSDPRKPEFVAAVDRTIAGTMSQLLHNEAFQRIERAWLGIKMLIRRLETDSQLRVYVMNVPEQALREDVFGDEDLTHSRLYKLLVDEASIPGAEPFTAVIGDYSFDASQESTDVLGRVAQIHAAAGTVFISAASPSILGCESLATSPDPDEWNGLSGEEAQQWAAVRSLPAARNVVLTVPRILGRRPYGTDSDAIESFAFEEIESGDAHDEFLWMNAAFGVATLLGQSFSIGGWNVSSAWEPALEGLPLHVFEVAGEEYLKPCGEIELPLRAVQQFADVGLTAVVSVRDSDAVRIPGLVSLSSTEVGVASAWS